MAISDKKKTSRNKILAWVERKLALDEAFTQECREYDNIDDMIWNLPPKFALQSWMRKRVSTVGHDIIRQALNIFNTYQPKFEILPRGAEDAERAERLERWGEWVMFRANFNGDHEVYREILKHAVKYARICIQTEYLPAWTKDKDARIDPFLVLVVNPAIVHYDMAGRQLHRVAVVEVRRAVDVLEHWEPFISKSRDGIKIESAVGVLQQMVDEDENALVVYVDYTDKTLRYVCFCKAEHEALPSDYTFPPAKDITVIVNSKLDVPFINWIIVRCTTGSILESLYKGGLIENQNFLKTLADSIVIRTGFRPEFIQEGIGTVRVNFSPDGTGIIQVPVGAKLTPTEQRKLDPAVSEILDRNTMDIKQSTGLENISSLNAANVQAAVVSMIVQLRLMELEPHKRAAEIALAEVLAMFFRWVKERGDEITALRQTSTEAGPRGELITLQPDDFDMKYLNISCTFLTKTPTDMQQKVNIFAQLRTMGMAIPDSEFIERLNEFGDPTVLREKWEKQQVQNLGVKLYEQKKLTEAEMLLRSMMQPPTGENPETEPAPKGTVQPALEEAGGQGNNPAGGGQSPYPSLPPQMRQTALRRP